MSNNLENSPGFSPESAADAIADGAGLGLFDGQDEATPDVETSDENLVSDRPWNEDVDEASGEDDPQKVEDNELVEDDKRASDEEAVSEDEDDAGADGKANAEGEQDLVELTIDGEQRQVPLEELTSAYEAKQKGELDFEQRVTSLTNEAQSVVSQHIQQVNQVRNQLVQELTQLQQYQSQRMPSPPDPSLADPSSPNYDPDKYTHQLASYQKADGENRALNQAIQQQKQQMEQEQQATLEAMRNTQRTELVKKWPEWNDPATRQQFLSDVQSEFGFSDEEVASIYDHRFYVLAKEAIAARKSSKAAQAPAKRVTRTAKPAGKPNQTKATDSNAKGKSRKDALQRVRRSSRLEDIAASFEDYLPNDIL
jgi:hypothetical protein